MPAEDESALERMRSRLYAPQDVGTLTPPPLSNRNEAVPRGWAQEAPPPLTMSRPRKKLPLSVWFLIVAIGFFVVAGGIAAYLLFVGGRSVSTDNINISVDGPTTAAGGDTVSLLVTVENHNPVPITATTLEMDFPDGTRSPTDVTQPLTHYDNTIGDLAAGQAVTQTVQAVVFGTQNQSVTIPVKVEYQTANSNAVFVKEQDYTLTLTTSPVSVTATSVSQISSGQPLTLSIAVRSNASKPLSDIALKADYPFGFTVTSTSIPSQNGLFDIDTLNPGQAKNITITGTLSGSDNDERIFHWSVGSTASSTNGTLGVAYDSTESDLTITQPFLGITLSLDGDTSGASTIEPGNLVQGIVKWTNTLPNQVSNGTITVAFSGSALDPASVTTQNGFYQSSNGTIRFDRDTDSDLATLQPGDTGTGTFSFKTKSGAALAALRNPSLTLTISASGQRLNESGVPDTLSSTLTQTLKVATGLTLSSDVVKTVGPFTNGGPLPPVAGTQTFYTVRLSAANDVNTVAGAVVTMTLPSYVQFTGMTSPADGSVTYSDATRQVRWNVGDIAAGASSNAAFQISFLPSISQQGTAPVLVSSQTISGTDRYTQTVVSDTAPALTIQASNDPAYGPSDGSVQ